MMHQIHANDYAEAGKKVPDPRATLGNLLTQHEPHQPLALAAFLNGTPTLASLDQLTSGEVQAMLDRLIGAPTYTVALWQRHLDERHEKDWGGELR